MLSLEFVCGSVDSLCASFGKLEISIRFMQKFVVFPGASFGKFKLSIGFMQQFVVFPGASFGKFKLSIGFMQQFVVFFSHREVVTSAIDVR